MSKTKVTKDLENKTLIIERVFNASKAKLWQAYANKEWFEKWWGPEGWETTTKAFDFKPGGTIHYGMECVDKNQGEWFGKESWGLMQIISVDEPNGFTVEDYFSDSAGKVKDDMPGQRLEVELVEEGDSTRMINRSICETTEHLEELVKMGMVEGFSSQLNKLDALLSE